MALKNLCFLSLCIFWIVSNAKNKGGLDCDQYSLQSVQYATNFICNIIYLQNPRAVLHEWNNWTFSEWYVITPRIRSTIFAYMKFVLILPFLRGKLFTYAETFNKYK